ncbi:DMT family transporter [Pedobacter heparinus]|uniref:DMT family transporter n=1 Tax=Pedobacter heparinus TaxID=984 RepID=UPI00292E85B7|nr:DMT family transporter [Pedobacter heparinus]
MKSSVFKGSILIAFGASCYGMLGTFVKLAYLDGFSTAEVTISQFATGFVILFVLSFFGKRKKGPERNSSDIRSIFRLVIAGSSLGLTSIFYYMAVQYISVGVAIVLLMQTVWMGVVLEMFLQKKAPVTRKIVAVFIILSGTVLATRLLSDSVSINWYGIGWGMLAAVTYTATMYTSNNLELHFPPLKRSLFMILGGLIIILLIFHASLNPGFSMKIFASWGLLVSLFGTVLPPLLFTRGMPLTGIGLGAIIASIEIPVALLTASILLKEPVSLSQWIGVVFILFAMAFMKIGAN